jgi:hypothetical protein
VTIIQYSLFLILWLFEDWGDTRPDINIVLLGFFVIGWLALIIGYYFPTKTSKREVHSTITSTKDITPISNSNHKNCPI